MVYELDENYRDYCWTIIGRPFSEQTDIVGNEATTQLQTITVKTEHGSYFFVPTRFLRIISYEKFSDYLAAFERS